MITHEYHAAYYKQDDGWYVVQLLDFPGVISQGKTLKSARWMIRDALKLMAESYLEDGQPLPTPNPKAKDKKAELVEPTRLELRVRAPAAS
ncbi:MAG: type II toxin-antitoxin system HicB family antitoxin [Gemmataceae bacterium]|nr:type II toxin-antitoxin system HicB family antitoxin [Gemmataceae bacterium]